MIGVAVAVALLALLFVAFPLLGPPTVQRSRYVTEFTLPSSDSDPLGIAVDTQGKVWVGLTTAKQLLSYTPATRTFREFAIPTDARSTTVWDMAVDLRGRIWFPSFEDNAFWRFDPASSEFHHYPLATESAQPIAVAIAPDGTVWFTELRGAKLGRIRPDSDRVEEFPVPTTEILLGDLHLAPDGTVWFAQIATSDVSKNRVGRFDPKTETFSEIQPDHTLFSPTGIAIVGGEVWLAEHGGSLIAKLEPDSGRVTRYATSPGTVSPASLPYWLAVDGTDTLWFNEHQANRLARFDPKSETLVEYEVPTRGSSGIANVLQFAVAPTGEVWFTEWTENKIGVVDPRTPIPFGIEVSPRTLELGQDAEVKTLVVVNGQSDRAIQLRAAGSFTATGRLLNVSAVFEPEEFARLLGDEEEAALTLLVPSSLAAGNYTLTVGATDGSVVRSVVVRLRVLPTGGAS
jgi:virginiamycin B lyase